MKFDNLPATNKAYFCANFLFVSKQKMSTGQDFELDNPDEENVANALNSDNEDFIDNVPISHRKKLKKRSPAWEYYEEVQENGQRYAKCKLCVDK